MGRNDELERLRAKAKLSRREKMALRNLERAERRQGLGLHRQSARGKPR